MIGLDEHGVYVIRNLANDKNYVGGAYRHSFQERWEDHRGNLRKGTHFNRHLQAAWNKYGGQNFVFRPLAIHSPESCAKYETLWIDFLESANRLYGYNRTPIGGSVLGLKWREESKARLSEVMKKLPLQPALKERQRPGWHHGANARIKISKAHKGRKMSPEAIEKRQKSRGKYIVSEETRAKLSALMKTRPLHSALAANNVKGRKASPETKQKMSVAQRIRAEKLKNEEVGLGVVCP